MVVEQPFSIVNRSGDVVRGDLRYQEVGSPKPLVLICHGFNTGKDWGPFPYCGVRLAESGFATIVFNFSHNGVGPGSSVCSEYDRFARNTPGKELEDITAVLDAVASGAIGGAIVDPSRIGMAGHSRGAGMSILTAVSDRRVRAVVAWSTVSEFLRVSQEERERWVSSGYLSLRYGNARTFLRYDVSVLHDLEENGERYDLVQGAMALRTPTLFIHGDDDAIVSYRETVKLFEASDRSLNAFELLSGAGHTYGTVHPFVGSTPALDRMLELTIQWFRDTLTEEKR